MDILEQKDSGRQDGETSLGAMIKEGADITGAATGAVVGYFAVGPVGAAAGGAGGVAAAHVLNRIGTEVVSRLLGPREKVRVGGALAIAADRIQERTKRGESIRQDGFFDPKQDRCSDAEEVVESVLLKCQREPEERKIRYMALLICNIAFDTQISPHLAHQIVKTAEALTYRQLCILKIAEIHKENYNLRTDDYRGQHQFKKSLYEVLYECLDLSHRSLINFGGEVVFGPTDIKPGSMSVQGLGADLFNLMGLAKIPQAHLDQIVAQLSS